MASNDDQKDQNANERHPAQLFEALHIHPALQRRRAEGSLRKLTPYFPDDGNNGSDGDENSTSFSPFIDFSSNDYLGLAQSMEQHDKVEVTYQKLSVSRVPGGTAHRRRLLGSTGSRLLTGDTDYAHQLEQNLALWHRREAALLCNSGYDANLAVLSCLGFNSTVIMDELAHNSLYTGVRSSRGCTVHLFRHNSLGDLENRLRQLKSERGGSNQHTSSSTKPPLIVIESVYSMDGDAAPLQNILDLALQYRASVIVDEAHGLGVYGRTGMGMIEEYHLENHPALLCSIHTFGKAAGCHGAVVCGSQSLKQYLYNYGRPIIYSTSLPIHSLVCIACSYQTMRSSQGSDLRRKVRGMVKLFRTRLKRVLNHSGRNSCTRDTPTNRPTMALVPSESPIQALIVPGNTRCVEFCERLWETSQQTVRLYPIRSPTVPKGQERVRVIIHAHNTHDEIEYLVDLIEKTISDILGNGVSPNPRSVVGFISKL